MLVTSPRLIARALRRLPLAPFRTGLILLLIAAVLANEAVGDGLLPRVTYVPAALPDDPLMAQVGDVPIYLSDLRAQAGAAEAAPEALLADGTLDDAADQLALALAAERAGLDEALEIRAQLALARRRILAEAYLDLAVRAATSEEAVRAAYSAEVAGAESATELSLRRLRVSSEDDAADAARRFARGEGESLGLVPMTDLSTGARAAVARLGVGQVSGLLRDEEGLYVLRLDARRGPRVPAYSARADVLRAALREAAITQAVEEAWRAPARGTAGAMRTNGTASFMPSSGGAPRTEP